VICPLCFNKQSLTPVKGPGLRDYLFCGKCKLIFADARFFLPLEEEKKRYLTHNNGIQYPGYVKFLNQAIEPALPHLTKGMIGLDYGCGPNPTLSLLIEKQGYKCDNYDPIFSPELSRKFFDFVFATECFEHFFFPEKEMKKLSNLLKPGGLLIVMTDKWKSIDAFLNWSYARDNTHVSFYHSYTFDFIAEKFKFQIVDNSHERVIIMLKTKIPGEELR
jgi:SAM-dependent methyltransferase